MTHINIIGRLDEIDQAINKYISRYDIQLEEKVSIESDTLNIYTKYFENAHKFVEMIGEYKSSYRVMGSERALEIIDDVERAFYEKDEVLKGLEEKKQAGLAIIKQLQPYINLELTASHLNYFEFIKYKLGKIPVANHKQLESFLYDFKELIFIESQRDDIYVYGAYFCPKSVKDEVGDIFRSLNFNEELFVLEFDDINFRGTLKNVYDMLENRLLTIEDKISIVQEDKLFVLGINKEDIIDAYSKIKQLYYNQSIKKYLAKVTDKFYVFAGWMPEEDAESLNLEIERDSKLIFVMDDTYKTEDIEPPIRLKNNRLFRPFELFVKTYGFP